MVYDDFRIVVLRIQKTNIFAEIEQHNLMVSEVLRQGNYEIKDSNIQDSPTELQMVLVLQRRPGSSEAKPEKVEEVAEEKAPRKAGRPKKEESAE